MSPHTPFQHWAVDEVGLTPDEVDALRLLPALEILVSRIEAAQARGAHDPVGAVSPTASGGNTRAATRSMLSSLGYTAAELRVVHRLMAGSVSGWPGLIRLYASGLPLTPAQHDYVRRQLRLLTRSAA
jgi:hypothetical protein